jgi:hypothetical protein
LEVVEQLTGLGVVQTADRLHASLLLSYELAGAFDFGVKCREWTLIHVIEPRFASVFARSHLCLPYILFGLSNKQVGTLKFLQLIV